MKKILYLMHVDWDWIFQRPHIFAKLLEKDYECTVVYPKSIINRESVVRRNPEPKDGRRAYRVPFQNYLGIIKKINKQITKNTIGKFDYYDVVWVCHPFLAEYIPNDYCGKVIYDCMDNHKAMVNENQRDELECLENRLLERADLVLVSSLKLREMISNDEKTVLVRNGYKESNVFSVSEVERKDCYKIGYFGTIASWFDFDLLTKQLRDINGIEYHIIGPCEGGQIENSHIYFEGTVEHSKLYEYVKDYDALIMPFVVNDIILSVDPVKLYEYISFGKCIISVYYPEIERFSPYVYFYRTQEEYNDLVTELKERGFPPKYTEEQQKSFLKENSWEYRYKLIKEEIDNLF